LKKKIASWKISAENKRKIKLILLFICILLSSSLTIYVRFGTVIWPKKILVICVAVITVVACLLEKKKLDRSALIIIIGFGVLSSLTTPVFHICDEVYHLERTMAFADGKIFTASKLERLLKKYDPNYKHLLKLKSTMKKNNNGLITLFDKKFWKTRAAPLNKEVDFPVNDFPNIAYVPQAIGMVVGKLLTPLVAVWFYLSRIFNVFFYALMAFFAIRKSKNFKQVLFVGSCLFSYVHIASLIHYDSLYYGATLLFFSMFFNFFTKERTINVKNLCAISCITLLFCFSKFPNVLLILLLIFIPSKYFSIKKWYSLFFIGATLALSFIYLKREVLISFFTHQQKYSVGNQAIGLFHSPNVLHDLKRLFCSVVHQFFELQTSGIFSYILGKPLDSIYTILLNGVIFLIIFLLSIKMYNMKFINIRLILGMISVLLLVMITTTVGISEDPNSSPETVDNFLVAGVQSRYYLSIVLIMPVLLARPVMKIFDRKEIAGDPGIDNILFYLPIVALIFSIGSQCFSCFN